MTADPIKTAEDAIVAALAAAFTSEAGSHVRELKTIPGEMTPEEAQRILKSTPGVYVGFQAADPGRVAYSLVVDGIFVVFVVAGGAAEDGRRREERGVALGGYRMAAIVARALQDLAIADVGTLRLAGIAAVAIDGFAEIGRTVYGLRFTLPLDLSDVDESTLADFATFHADWDLAGGKVPTGTLPETADHADAQDTVTGLDSE